MSHLTQSNSRSDVHAVAVRRRPDLEAVRTRHRREAAIVIKDPIAMKYYRLRPDEYFVLEQLDGTASLDQIRERYEQRFAPQKVSTSHINQLLFRFHRCGLTVSSTALQGEQLRDRRNEERREQWVQRLSGILFIRFPGVDPEPLLKRLYPLVRPVLSPVGVAIIAILCLFAGGLFATRFDQFISEFPKVNDWIRLESLLILGAVIGVTKVLHELGHAMTCKHFGGECHQIGPMLLVFTPALYCDTSDSWMLPSRWQRAVVGMAGIGTEVILAALATLIWVTTAPGLTHYIAMNVMLVCSVSTLMFNANPLLRYDGYFVLSDLCDVPNLAEKSKSLLTGYCNRLFLGFDELPPDTMPLSTRFWMLTYAILAVAYRWSLTLFILWFVSLLLRPYGLESVGLVLCTFAAIGLGYSLVRGPVRFLRNPARRRQVQSGRATMSIVAVVCLIAMAWIPLPSGVSADARILPRQETPIYIATPGLLRRVDKVPGETVVAGEPIAKLVNHDVELQYLTAKGRYETQIQMVQAIRRSAIDTPEVANDLPAQEALLNDLREQLTTREQRREQLTIHAPISGKLIAAPHRRASEKSTEELGSWTGFPTDPQNQNCLLQPGHELMSVSANDHWDAELTLSQSQIQRIKVGAPVKLVLEAMPHEKFEGVVCDISRGQWTAGQHAPHWDDDQATHHDRPAGTSYVVRVQLEATELPLVAGATATSRVETPSTSLVGRTTRFFSGLFRFR